MVFYFRDPARTAEAQVNDGVEYRGGWTMTWAQKEEVDRLGREEGWEFARCAESVGASWDAGCK